MKKRVLIIILCGFLIIGLTGCNNEKTNVQMPEESTEESIGIEEKFKELDFKCDALSEDEIMGVYVSYSSEVNSFLITKSGNLYDIDFDKIFSNTNNQNCKLVDTDIKFKKLFSKAITVGTDNKVYRKDKITQNPLSDWKGNLDDIVSYISLPISACTFSKDDTCIHILKNDGNVYEIIYENGGSKYVFLEEKIVYSSENLDSKIIKYDHENRIVMTEHAIYNFENVITNLEECSTYADVECISKVDFEKDELLSNIYDKIEYYDGLILITKDGKIYLNEVNDRYHNI